ARPHYATIQNRAGKPGGLRQALVQQQVGDALLVDRGFQGRAAADQRGVETSFDFPLPLGDDGGEPGTGGEEERGRAADVDGVEPGELLPVERLVSRDADRGAQLELVDESPEQLEAVGRGPLGKEEI